MASNRLEEVGSDIDEGRQYNSCSDLDEDYVMDFAEMDVEGPDLEKS
jgi:hypothetical protein